MACPECGCKETYQYDNGDDCSQSVDHLERCAACGHVFDVEDHAYEEDDELESSTATSGVKTRRQLSRDEVRLAVQAAVSSGEWNTLASLAGPQELLEFCRKFGDAVLAANGVRASAPSASDEPSVPK